MKSPAGRLLPHYKSHKRSRPHTHTPARSDIHIRTAAPHIQQSSAPVIRQIYFVAPSPSASPCQIAIARYCISLPEHLPLCPSSPEETTAEPSTPPAPTSCFLVLDNPAVRKPTAAAFFRPTLPAAHRPRRTTAHTSVYRPSTRCTHHRTPVPQARPSPSIAACNPQGSAFPHRTATHTYTYTQRLKHLCEPPSPASGYLTQHRFVHPGI